MTESNDYCFHVITPNLDGKWVKKKSRYDVCGWAVKVQGDLEGGEWKGKWSKGVEVWKSGIWGRGFCSYIKLSAKAEIAANIYICYCMRKVL